MAIEPQPSPGEPGSSKKLLESLILHDLPKLAGSQYELDWQPFYPGVEVHWIYRGENDGASAALIRFQPGGRVPLHEHRGYEHIYLLHGSQTDENGTLRAGSLKVNPPGTRHSIVSEEGCLVLAIYEKRAKFITSETPSVS